jgi:hypothetical protein
VAAGGALALFFGGSSISLAREQLHLSCSMGPAGSEGADTWSCADGIGYLWFAATLGLIWLLTLLVGSIAAGGLRDAAVARALLVVLAAAASASVFGLTWYGATELVIDDFAPMSGAGYWANAVGPAAAIAGIALIAGVVSLLLRGRSARVLGALAGLVLTLAAFVQPGVGIGIVPAAALLVAAAVRSVDPARRS